MIANPDEVEISELVEAVAIAIGEMELSDEPELITNYLDRVAAHGYKYRMVMVIHDTLASRGVLSREFLPEEKVYRTPQLNPPIT